MRLSKFIVKFMHHKLFIPSLLILAVGIIYRLVIVSDGGFIFNMDNARDMIDVREMVVLRKFRLIGPTSGVEGIYNGPAWYYLLALPFVVSSGNPYAPVLLMVVFWFIGGFFMLQMLSRYNLPALLAGGWIWIASSYVVLGSRYSFNPNPVLLLTPCLIFLLDKYLKDNSLWMSLAAWFLGGLFFNFEMAFGLFIPLIFLLSVSFIRPSYLKSRNFWLGSLAFIFTLSPQILFYLKNWTLLANSLSGFLSGGYSWGLVFKLHDKLLDIVSLYLEGLISTLLKWEALVGFAIFGMVFLTLRIFLDKSVRKDKVLIISTLFLLVPFVGSTILPLKFMFWHIGGSMAAVIILVAILLYQIEGLGSFFKKISYLISLMIVFYSVLSLRSEIELINSQKNTDPAIFSNEVRAIDYVYKGAGGTNFKVYTYLPSVYDYPYQYLFWWYGQGKYGYLPEDYAYLPKKPAYIKNKEIFSNGYSPVNSGLVFLIKQPDQINQRHLWENNFSNLRLMTNVRLGPLDVEMRKEAVE